MNFYKYVLIFTVMCSNTLIIQASSSSSSQAAVAAKSKTDTQNIGTQFSLNSAIALSAAATHSVSSSPKPNTDASTAANAAHGAMQPTQQTLLATAQAPQSNTEDFRAVSNYIKDHHEKAAIEYLTKIERQNFATYQALLGEVDPVGNTLIFHAVLNKSYQVVKKLIQHSNLKYQNKAGYTLFLTAINSGDLGHIKKIWRLLKKTIDIDATIKIPSGEITILQLAIYLHKDKQAIIEFIIKECKADIFNLLPTLFSVLSMHYALDKPNHSLQLLLECEEEERVNTRDFAKEELELAIENKDIKEVFQIIQQRLYMMDSEVYKLLVEALKKLTPKETRMLLRARNKSGQNLLMLASVVGMFDVVELICKKKETDLDQTCSQGHTALTRAILSSLIVPENVQKIMTTLLEHGANPNILLKRPENTGRDTSALADALRLCNVGAVEILLENDATDLFQFEFLDYFKKICTDAQSHINQNPKLAQDASKIQHALETAVKRQEEKKLKLDIAEKIAAAIPKIERESANKRAQQQKRELTQEQNDGQLEELKHKKAHEMLEELKKLNQQLNPNAHDTIDYNALTLTQINNKLRALRKQQKRLQPQEPSTSLQGLAIIEAARRNQEAEQLERKMALAQQNENLQPSIHNAAIPKDPEARSARYLKDLRKRKGKNKKKLIHASAAAAAAASSPMVPSPTSSRSSSSASAGGASSGNNTPTPKAASSHRSAFTLVAPKKVDVHTKQEIEDAKKTNVDFQQLFKKYKNAYKDFTAKAHDEQLQLRYGKVELQNYRDRLRALLTECKELHRLLLAAQWGESLTHEQAALNEGLRQELIADKTKINSLYAQAFKKVKESQPQAK